MPKLEIINISKTESIFRCIILVVFYLQLNRGSFESKYNYLMLSLFKLTTCFGPCAGIVRYITKYFCVCNHPDSVALYCMSPNACFGLQL